MSRVSWTPRTYLVWDLPNGTLDATIHVSGNHYTWTDKNGDPGVGPYEGYVTFDDLRHQVARNLWLDMVETTGARLDDV